MSITITILCKLSLPNFGFEMSSLPALELKCLNQTVYGIYRIYQFSLEMSFTSLMLSSIGARMLKTIISHQQPLTIIHITAYKQQT
jgi:hypothetical protein